KEKAEESNRLKSAFLATMSHELRTPLNHVLGFSDMIPDMTDDESIKEFAGLIHESGSNLLNIIEDIFDLAMVEQSEIKIREDVVFIRDIYTELKNQLQEVLSESNKNDNIRINSKIDSSIATRQIITDKSKVIQVMSNIIKNAVKYTHNGEISFSLMFVEGNYLSIKVKDTGIGIPKDKLEIIFEFFRQGDDSHTRKYEGVGIGLAISKRIANAMGGTIKVESELDMGSEFTFSFPLTIIEENMINPEKENTSFTVPDLSGKNILIVEDDTIGMGMIVNLLKPSKCKIINAVNGKEAIEVIKANPETDIILMDLKMPVMDGFEATRAIRKEFSDLPIIALTAYSLQKDKRKALDAGCNDIITKPIKKEIMFNKLQDFLVK
ncbi:MAG: response regulator, partial [Bacteroidetes bacterium]|nr:response regulator [Bacteroidota bacterium]